MRENAAPSSLPLGLSPAEVIARWPADEPLAAMVSGRPDARFGHRSLLASPKRVIVITRKHLHEFTNGLRTRSEPIDHPLAALDELARVDTWPPTTTRAPGRSLIMGGGGGWMLALAYRLGHVIEPAARRDHGQFLPAVDEPLIVALECPAMLSHDTLLDQWCATGDAAECDRLRALALGPSDAPAPFALKGFAADRPAEDYESKVNRVLEYIRAGDIFQANIARRFTASIAGSARALAAAAFNVARPLYGAYLELPAIRSNAPEGLLSLSPELFLHVDPTMRTVRTRPIKGTRPPSGSLEELRESSKDAAELHMIVDLMRNDLGRVCAPGSIHVRTPRAIERHPTVMHAVAEVAGTLREGVSLGDLLRATFPPGSVTGAPKIRAMQIIDELEGFDRGFYCGAIGWLSARGELTLNVAIRTASLRLTTPADHSPLEYCAGAGIVADSVPADEAAECETKADVLMAVANRAESAVTPERASVTQRIHAPQTAVLAQP